MDNRVAQGFYGSLAQGTGEKYLLEARRFIPKYDEMAEEVTDILTLFSPTRILDIGSGIGNIERLIFQKLPNSTIACVETSPDMARTSRINLEQYARKVQVINQDILDFLPNESYDAVVSNIVLHNVPYKRKPALFERINGWLADGGVLVWSDLIKYSDEKIQQHVLNQRLRFALEKGATQEFARENFDKETKHDYPLTPMESIELLKEAGFQNIQIKWMHGAFSIFYARK
ncbi:MAG: class I SAM-dependent methyltransferase [Candidatus Diapherotrites archaeon]